MAEPKVPAQREAQEQMKRAAQSTTDRAANRQARMRSALEKLPTPLAPAGNIIGESLDVLLDKADALKTTLQPTTLEQHATQASSRAEPGQEQPATQRITEAPTESGRDPGAAQAANRQTCETEQPATPEWQPQSTDFSGLTEPQRQQAIADREQRLSTTDGLYLGREQDERELADLKNLAGDHPPSSETIMAISKALDQPTRQDIEGPLDTLKKIERDRAALQSPLQRLAALGDAAGREGGSGPAFKDAIDRFRQTLIDESETPPFGGQYPANFDVLREALTLWDNDPGDIWGVNRPTLRHPEMIIDADAQSQQDLHLSAPEYATIPAVHYKCSPFVWEVVYRSTGLRDRAHMSKEEPGKYFGHKAEEWADPAVTINHFTVVQNPQPGDIWAEKHHPEGGHMGVYLGNGLYISARADADGVFGVKEGVQKHLGIQIKFVPVGGTYRRYTPEVTNETAGQAHEAASQTSLRPVAQSLDSTRVKGPEQQREKLEQSETRTTLPGFSSPESKAIHIVSTFETGSPMGYSALTGNSDGQGLSFGPIQWNIGTGSLIPLLTEFDKSHPALIEAIFGPETSQLRQMLRLPKNDRQGRMDLARSINDAEHHIVEPWATHFKELGRDPDFQSIERKTIRERMENAKDYARQYGLTSERGLALMFDTVVNQGPWWPQVRDREKLIDQRLKEVRDKEGRAPDEHEIMVAIANVVAETVAQAVAQKTHNSARGQKAHDRVLGRKMAIIDGAGRVHGHNFDMQQEFGLTDAAWEGTKPAAATPTRPSIVREVARAGDTTLTAVQVALSRNVWSENGLTDLIFYTRHPELGSRPLMPEDKVLRQEWRQLRSSVARPALQALGIRPATAEKNTRPVKATPHVPENRTTRAGDIPSGDLVQCFARLDRRHPSSNWIQCNDSVASRGERPLEPSAKLVDVPEDLKRDPGTLMKVDSDTLEAYRQLIAIARADGIPEPYLKIGYAYRDYEKEAGIWKRALLIRADKATLAEPTFVKAIDATSATLRDIPVPHAPDLWKQRFLHELQKNNCALPVKTINALYQKARAHATPPGMSPHQSGRALDIHVGEKEIRLGASQARDGAKGVRELWVPLAYAWLVQNAGRFGFRPYLFEGHYHHWEYNPPK